MEIGPPGRVTQDPHLGRLGECARLDHVAQHGVGVKVSRVDLEHEPNLSHPHRQNVDPIRLVHKEKAKRERTIKDIAVIASSSMGA